MAVALIGEFEGRRISRMLERLFVGRLEPGEGFVVRGQHVAGWVSVGFDLSGGARAYRVTAKIDAGRLGVRPQDAKDHLIDLLGHLFEGYLQPEREPFSGPTWEKVEYEGLDVFLRGQERDEAAELEADALLERDARERST